jgi:hypothetical protein
MEKTYPADGACIRPSNRWFVLARGNMKKLSGIQKAFTTVGGLAILPVLLFSTPTTAKAQTITNMTAGGSISLYSVIDSNLEVQVGDKLFGNFFFSYNDTSGGSQVPVTESNVTLSTISNVIGFGLQFSQPLLAVGPIVKDIVFEYSAQVVQPSSNMISDIHLSITGTDGNGGVGSVGETAYVGGFGGTTVGTFRPPYRLRQMMWPLPISFPRCKSCGSRKT